MHKAEANYSSYVSCIRIGNQPILPPLLDSCTRQTVRYMKQKAVELERKLSLQNVVSSAASYKLNDDSEMNEINPLILSSACRTSSLEHDDYNDNYVNDDDHTTAGNITFNSSSVITENEDEFLPAVHRTRQNSYTLERPSEVVLTYLRSLFINDDNVNNNSNNNNNDNDNTHKLLLEDDVTTTSSSISVVPVLDSKIHARDELNLTTDEENIAECHESAVEIINSNERENNVVADCNNEVNSIIKNGDICSNEDCNNNRNFDYCIEPIIMQDTSQSVNRANVIINGDNNCLISSARLFNDTFENNNNPRWLISDITVNNVLPVSSEGEIGGEPALHMNDRQVQNCSNFRSFINVGNNMNSHVLSPGSNDEMDRKTYRSYGRLFHQLKLKHIADLTELLEKQKNEQANLIAQLHNFFLPAAKLKSAALSDVCTDQYSYCVSCSIDNNDALAATTTPNNRIPAIENVDNKKCDKNAVDESVEMEMISEINKQTTEKQKEIEDDSFFKQQRKKAAATVINAAVRGYLTRRLFKTDRVSNFVHIIRDCIFIAMSLQNENELTLPDLDLQCRLLQQLAGACNELNDIFSLPVKERMEIIANDRQKKLNTLLVKDISENETVKQVLKCKTNLNTVNKTKFPVNNRSSLQHKRQYFSAAEKNYFNKSSSSILKQKYSTRQQQTDKRPWR